MRTIRLCCEPCCLIAASVAAIALVPGLPASSAQDIADTPLTTAWQIETLRGDCVAVPEPDRFDIWDIESTADGWYFAGSFRMVRDPAGDETRDRFRPGFCRFDHAGAFDATFDPFGGSVDQYFWDPDDVDFLFDDVNAIALSPAGDRLYAGGRFKFGVQPDPVNIRRRHLVALDPQTGRDLGWNPNVPTLVNDLAVSADGQRVYVAYATGVQAYDVNGNPDPTFPTLTMQRQTQDFATCTLVGAPNSAGARVVSIDEETQTLYVGGSFTAISVDGAPFVERLCVAAIDLTTHQLLPFNARFCNNGTGQTGRIIEIIVAGGYVYCAGDWWQTQLADGTWSGCQERQRNINRFDRYTGLLDEAWLPWTDGGIQGLAVDVDRNLAVITGHFDWAGSVDPSAVPAVACDDPYPGALQRDLMAVDLCDGTPLDWSPGSAGCSLSGIIGPSVYPARIEGARLALGGPFQSTGGAARTGVALYDMLTPPCPGDLDRSGTVDFADLLDLLGKWSNAGCADLNGSGTVGFDDVIVLIGQWGPCG